MTKQTFEQWLVKVNRTLTLLASMTHTDLENVDWRVLWERGMCPLQSARKALIATFGSL